MKYIAKKNIVSFMLVLILLSQVILVTGCGDEPKEIAVLIYDQEDPFIESIGKYIESLNMGKYSINIYDCKKSQLVQNEIAEKLYKDGIDLMIINPVERLSSYIFVSKSAKEKVPIIFFNREPLKEDIEKSSQVYYVGMHADESGILQARLIDEAFGGNPQELNAYDKSRDDVIQCGILKGEQGHQDSEERTKVVIEELEDLGYAVEVLFTQVENWSEEEAYRDMGELMDTYGSRMEVLISNNDAMAIGAAKYLRDYRYVGLLKDDGTRYMPFFIVGIDGLEETKTLIDEQLIYGTVYNDGENMAKAILNLSEYILGDSSKLDYTLVDKRYIWIPYKKSYE